MGIFSPHLQYPAEEVADFSSLLFSEKQGTGFQELMEILPRYVVVDGTKPLGA